MTTPTQEPSPAARTAYGVNAAIAWLGIVLTAFFSGLDLYSEPPPEPGLYGNHADGLAGALPRLFDTFSYFTIWSNLVVAISATLLWRRPWRDTTGRRVLRMDALLMITVTAIVYQVLLAPTTEVIGWSNLTDPILHVITPLVTVVVWVISGSSWVGHRQDDPGRAGGPGAVDRLDADPRGDLRRLPLRLRQHHRVRRRCGLQDAGDDPGLRLDRRHDLLGHRCLATSPSPRQRALVRRRPGPGLRGPGRPPP
ncbi:MAG: Pr6Pr family membrane protein [Nocardioides sp.]